MYNAKITALGCYVPPGLLTNQDLEQMVDTNNDWIVQRVGILQRHIAPPEIATSDMAVEAAKVALEQRGIDAAELDAILVCTVTPDMLFPSTACLVQDRLGAKHAWGFDLVAACSGFIYGLTTAAHLVSAGSHKKVLVIGSDTMSRIIDYTDRSTCILFGDGAGAMLVEPTEEGETGFIDFVNQIDGSGGDYLKQPAGGSRIPASAETVAQRLHYVKQDGQQVFKYAVRKMEETSRESVGAQSHDGGRCGRDDSASGQSAHYRGGGGAPGHQLRSSGDQYRSVRKYHGRDHSFGDTRRLALREAQKGRPGAVRSGGRGLHGGREFVALADVDARKTHGNTKSGGVWMPGTAWHRTGGSPHRAGLSSNRVRSHPGGHRRRRSSGAGIRAGRSRHCG